MSDFAKELAVPPISNPNIAFIAREHAIDENNVIAIVAHALAFIGQIRAGRVKGFFRKSVVH